jgi:hypothetical protein
MLELIVQMESLGDIDVEGNGIDFNDFFFIKDDGQVDKEQYSEAYNNFIESMRA